MNDDEKWMRRCLQLARQGSETTAPNPMVGAVVVCDGRIEGEGYHVRAGEPHAEVNALRAVKHPECLSKSTLYVSLEPCSHQGRTPPCADLIIRKGLRRVVVGCVDPNPRVGGRGIERLRKAGIEVTVGVLEKDCWELNRIFMTFQTKGRPFITLKWAQSADGFIAAAGCRRWVSTKRTQMWAHRLRAERSAILVGRHTAESDNPRLNVRQWAGRDPLRIVLDRYGVLDQHLHIMDRSVPTLIVGEKPAPYVNRMLSDSFDKASQKDSLQPLDFLQVDYTASIWPALFEELKRREITSVLIEGGAEVLRSLVRENLWDEAYVEIGTERFKSGVMAPMLPATAYCEERRLWNHIQRYYRNTL